MVRPRECLYRAMACLPFRFSLFGEFVAVKKSQGTFYNQKIGWGFSSSGEHSKGAKNEIFFEVAGCLKLFCGRSFKKISQKTFGLKNWL